MTTHSIYDTWHEHHHRFCSVPFLSNSSSCFLYYKWPVRPVRCAYLLHQFSARHLSAWNYFLCSAIFACSLAPLAVWAQPFLYDIIYSLKEFSTKESAPTGGNASSCARAGWVFSPSDHLWLWLQKGNASEQQRDGWLGCLVSISAVTAVQIAVHNTLTNGNNFERRTPSRWWRQFWFYRGESRDSENMLIEWI